MKKNAQIILNFLLTFKEEKKFLFYFSVGILVLAGLTIGNYLFSIRGYGGAAFFINWMAARNLIFKGISPYSPTAVASYNEAANLLKIVPSSQNYHFTAPLYALFLYFPFAIFTNFTIARAIWMTLLEVAAVISGLVCFEILDWVPNKKIKYLLLVFSIISFFTIINIQNGTDLIIVNYCFLLGIFFLVKEKYELSGIIFTLIVLNYQIYLIPFFGICIYVFRKKAWTFYIWFLLITLLLGVVSALFVTDWPFQNLREILINQNLSALQLSGEVLKSWIPGFNPVIGNSISILLFIWLIYELMRKNITSQNYLWKLCFMITLSEMIIIQNNIYGLLLQYFVFIYIFYQWIKRDKKIGTIFSILTSATFSIIFLILGYFTKALQFTNSYPFFFYISPLVFLLVNLYWIRGWVVKNISLDYEN